MYALCFYYLSPGPSRDQTMTGHALIAINEFMSRYPPETASRISSRSTAN